MSTIKVDTLQTRSGSTAAVTGAGFVATDQIRGNTAANSVTVVGEGGSTTTNLQQGLTKVWCRFNGTSTVAIGDSFNTTSITDHSTGLYTVTYANDMANANHSPHVTSGVSGATWGLQQNDVIAAGSHKFILFTPDGTATDNSVVPTSSNGDLA